MTDADLPEPKPLWHEAPRRGSGGPRGPPPGLLGDGAHRMLQHSLHMGRQQFPGAGVQPAYGRQPPPQQYGMQPQYGYQQGPPQYGGYQQPMQPQYGYQQPPQQFGGHPQQGFQQGGGTKFMGGAFGGPPPGAFGGPPPMQQQQFGGFTPAYQPGMPPPQQPFGGPPPQQFGGAPPQQQGGFYGQPPPQQQGGFAQGNRFAALQRRQ